MCISPAAFQAEACIDLCKLPHSERLHSHPGHIFWMSSSPMEITTLLRAECPVFTSFHLQASTEFTFCVCADNLVAAASISPSHSYFLTGKSPGPPFFNLNYSHQEEKQRDGDGCQVRAEGTGQGGSFSRVWDSWAQQCSHPLLAVGSKLLMSSQYNPAGFIGWKWGVLPQWNVAGPFRCTHCDSATFVLGQFIHYFASQPHALGHDTGNFLHVQMHFNFSFAQDSNADHLSWLMIKLEVKVSGW